MKNLIILISLLIHATSHCGVRATSKTTAREPENKQLVISKPEKPHNFHQAKTDPHKLTLSKGIGSDLIDDVITKTNQVKNVFYDLIHLAGTENDVIDDVIEQREQIESEGGGLSGAALVNRYISPKGDGDVMGGAGCPDEENEQRREGRSSAALAGEVARLAEAQGEAIRELQAELGHALDELTVLEATFPRSFSPGLLLLFFF